MATDTASIWSAVAASFSAMSAITIALIHRLNRIDSSRPEILLDGWSRVERSQGEKKYDVLKVNKIRNTGKGSALHVSVNSAKFSGENPVVIMSTVNISIIPSGNEVDINSELSPYWKSIKPDDAGHKNFHLKIRVLCWCTSGYRHETIYQLSISEVNTNVFIQEGSELASGVMLLSRHTTVHSVWKLKLYSKLLNLPIVGNMCEKTLKGLE